MINELTWHPREGQRTVFTWQCSVYGIKISHDSGNVYTIPWEAFIIVIKTANEVSNNNIAIAGVSMTTPTGGSVGERIIGEKIPILPNGYLTPRHLSFLGPIMGRMGIIIRACSQS